MYRLLFAGRMVRPKGLAILLKALPSAARTLTRRLHLTIAGDGPSRPELERQAKIVCARNPIVSVTFTGWRDGTDLHELFKASDLLVVPSLWPEPFGLIGPEAGRFGLPAVAFDMGGIREWLRDGINGFLAPANPPRAMELAIAIAKCLNKPDRYRQLRKGARAEAEKFRLADHLGRLLEIFHYAENSSNSDYELIKSTSFNNNNRESGRF
jgi:glycosyltransferase involved in cell wall biosynthesis